MDFRPDRPWISPWRALGLLALLGAGALQNAVAAPHETLHAFEMSPRSPTAALVQGSDGFLYGTTTSGGTSNYGTVFRVAADGSSFTTLVNFNSSNGANPQAALLQGSDGFLYGTTNQGGAAGFGTVFRVAADGSSFTTLVTLDLPDGAHPYGSLVQGSDGFLYGTTNSGGTSGFGTVFRVATNGNSFSAFVNFNFSNGANPRAGLMQGNDGLLYGTTTSGGTSGLGTVFRVAPAGTPFGTIVNFDSSNGQAPFARVVQGSDGFLYGTTTSGGTSFYGTAFRVATDGSAFSTLVNFNSSSGTPRAGLMQGSDGFLYGTSYGGLSNQGTVFRVATNGSSFNTLVSFNSSNGATPYAALIQGSDGLLYGTSNQGGTSGVGTVFRVATDGNSFSTLVNFNSANGAVPLTGLVQGSDGFLYGTTSQDGASGAGTVFRVAPDGSSFSTLVHFNSSNGANPRADLLQASDGFLYGTTENGGASNYGTVFRVATDGSSFTTLVHFNSSNGATPYASLMQGSDGILYGTTWEGGTTGVGTVFRVATDGSSLSTLVSFDRTNGELPFAGLVQGADGFLYGTTYQGGASGYGTVFRVATDGTSFSTLVHFDSSNGAYPYARLVQGTDGFLYGTTYEGGTLIFGGTPHGTVFRVATDGSSFSSLVTFDSANGANPYAGLVQGSDGSLYGTTVSGGTENDGTVFQMVPGGGTVSTLVHFNSSNGAHPYGGVVQGANGDLYGTSGAAGGLGGGTVFRQPLDDGVANDFGDAPDPTYPTLLANDGARHANGALRLGELVDSEDDGQPDETASGDDAAEGDDEDGLSFGTLIAGEMGSVEIAVTGGSGVVDAWMDFDADGDWDDDADHIFMGEPVSEGSNALVFPIPGDAVAGMTYARFRLTSVGIANYAGAAPDGEVEDERVTLVASDSDPEPFLFEDAADVEPGALMTSSTVTVSGINVAASVGVQGGAYSIGCTASFTSTPGAVSNGQTVCVRHTSSSSFETAVNTTLTVGGVSDTFTSTTRVADTTPNAFAFTDQVDVEPSNQVTSAPVTITGIEAAASVSVSGGSYSVGCTATYTSVAGTVENGQTVCVRHTSSSSFQANTGTTLTVGGASDTFTSTTRAADVAPDAFSFTDQAGVEPGGQVTSAPVIIAGIEAPASVSVSGGSYAIGCSGTFSSSAGTIANGQTVCVRHTASSAFDTATSTTLTVGGVSDTFTSTTGAEPPDTAPDPFSFPTRTGIATGSVVTSASVAVGGIDAAAAISINLGELRINNGSFVAAPANGMVNNGDTVTVRHTASTSLNTSTATTVTIGGVPGSFTSVTTQNVDGSAGDTGSVNDTSAQPVAVSSNAGTIENLAGNAPPAGAPTTFIYPNGFFSFDITGLNPGNTVLVTFTLPPGSNPTAYVKCPAGGNCAPFSGASISGNTVTLTLVDGGAGDADGVANGVISDPGAPARGTGGGGGGGGAPGLPLLLGLAGAVLLRLRSSGGSANNHLH